jgi:transcriptional regulator with XRE-family HTH domain
MFVMKEAPKKDGAEQLEQVIAERFDGNQAAFAEAAGVSPQAVGDWLKRRRAPDRVSAALVEKAAGVPALSWARPDGRRPDPHQSKAS